MDLVVHDEGAADDAGIAAERAVPELVPEQHHRSDAGPLVVVGEAPAEDGPDAEDVEELPGDDAGLHPHRFAAAEEREVHRVLLDDAAKAGGLGAIVSDFQRREAGVEVRLPDVLPQMDDPVAARIGQGTQEHAVDDAEDGGVRSDAEREREQDDRGEAGALAQSTGAVADVLRHRGEARRGAVPDCVAGHRQPEAEPAARGVFVPVELGEIAAVLLAEAARVEVEQDPQGAAVHGRRVVSDGVVAHGQAFAGESEMTSSATSASNSASMARVRRPCGVRR